MYLHTLLRVLCICTEYLAVGIFRSISNFADTITIQYNYDGVQEIPKYFA